MVVLHVIDKKAEDPDLPGAVEKLGDDREQEVPFLVKRKRLAGAVARRLRF